jgi:6-pyruvoyltetrahydropterin/6-carboxytetrahydropterin synthase
VITVSKEIEFDAGHRVPNHASKCKNPHGHRYRVRLTCAGDIVNDPQDPEYGMLTDFGSLKTMLTMLVHDVLDHAMIVHKDDDALLEAMSGRDWKVVVFPLVPTAENLARWVWMQCGNQIDRTYEGRLWLQLVSVWETPTSVAHYSEPR